MNCDKCRSERVMNVLGEIGIYWTEEIVAEMIRKIKTQKDCLTCL